MLSTSIALMLAAAPPPAGTYVLDGDRTFLLVQLRPDESRLLSGLSHQHVIRATHPEGRVVFDPERPTACAIRVQARVSDLEVDAPYLRRKVGYEDVLDDDDREDIRENMLDDDQLDAERHSDIRFVGNRCDVQSDGRVKVQGQLTVRGKAQPLDLSMAVDHQGGVLRARGQFTLNHAAFGFEPYSAALGALANDDWLKFTVEIVARAKAATLLDREPAAPPGPSSRPTKTRSSTVGFNGHRMDPALLRSSPGLWG